MNKKELIGVILYACIIIAIISFGIDRNKKINNGEMTQRSESYMK